MAYSVNWATKVVTIPLTDLTLVSGTNYTLDAGDVWIELRRLEASPSDGLWTDQIAEFVNTQVLSGLSYSAILKMINGYTWDTDTTNKTISLLGINNNLLDTFIPGNGISVLANNSAGKITTGSGLLPAEQTQLADIHGQVQRSVYINTEALVNGNGYQQTPYDNFTDAVDYAEANGLQILRLEADADLDRNLANFELIGIDLPTFDLQGFSASSLIVRECTVTGVQGGPQFPLLCLVCNIRDLTGFNGSMLTVTVETRVAIAAGAFCLINEVVPAIGGSPWELDMGATGAASTVQMQNISGGMNITNMDNVGDGLHMAFISGAVTIEASCTAGSITITGSVKVTDNSGVGCTVDISATDEAIKYNHLMENGETFEESQRLQRAAAAGKVVQAADGSYAIRDAADSKDRIVGDDSANSGRDITSTDGA